MILDKILKVVKDFKEYEFVIAGLKHINFDLYKNAIKKNNVSVSVVFDNTYELLKKADAAIVTSGTATLETALIGTPQIVCYITNPINMFLAKLFVKIKFISLVNLILNKETVRELIQSDVNKKNIKKELSLILGSRKNEIKKDYESLRNLLSGEKIEEKIVRHIIKN